MKKQNAELQRDNAALRRDLEILRSGGRPENDETMDSYSAAFKPGGVYGAPLDTQDNSGNNTGDLGATVNSNSDAQGASSAVDPALAALEDHDMTSHTQNEAPLDTDAIRESLTQVGERID